MEEPMHNGGLTGAGQESAQLVDSIFRGEAVLITVRDGLAEEARVIIELAFAAGGGGSHSNLRIIIDSGASSHMLPCPNMFVGGMRAVQGRVSLGKSEYKLAIVGEGKTLIEVLETVFLVPDLSFGLISVSRFDANTGKVSHPISHPITILNRQFSTLNRQFFGKIQPEENKK